MRHRHHGCGPRGRFEINLPEGLMAMRGGRGWQGQWGPFSFDFGEDGGRGRGGRRYPGRKRMFEGGELRLVLLKLIADQPRHGYDLIRAIEELTGGEYAPSPGVVYPTLTMLQDMGLIERLSDMKPNEESSAGPAIGRAVKNLMTALGHRVGREGMNEELLHEIAAILDEAAQRIERVK